MSSIQVGSFGWETAAFLQSFYPADLPEDWRLGFYANEFNCVLIPAAVWCDSDLDIEEWQEVPEGFRFYLQQAEVQCSEQLQNLTESLGEKLAGSVKLDTETVTIEKRVAIIDSQQCSLREWRVWLEQNAEQLDAIILKDSGLSYSTLNDFKSLLELMGL